MQLKKILLVSLALPLTACSGGSSDDGDASFGLPAQVELLTGVLLDSPVGNIDYSNASGSNIGVTNATGEYRYSPGETLTFSIGDLKFPAVRAGAITTPMDLANTLIINNPKVTNMVRLLISLDKDSNPNNGITITDTAKAVATQVDFSLSAADFAASSAVTTLVLNGGQDAVVPELVTITEAVDHFREQLVSNNITYNVVAEENDTAIRNYLADNNLEATFHESGLYFNITQEGSGDSPTVASTVEVKYKGSLLDGTVFDQTVDDATASFPLSSLIVGWQIGVPFLKPGSKATFYFPSALGYGSQGSGQNIPGDAVLIFEIELIDFI